MFLSALQSLIPSLFALVLPNAPFSSKAKLHGDVPQIEVTRFPRPMSPLQDVSLLLEVVSNWHCYYSFMTTSWNTRVQPAERVYYGLSVSCKTSVPGDFKAV
ncbi:unnamed protein product [Rangifer tarandus platyrhynchus]